MAEQPIIIKKIKKSAGHGHHGGAWKIAYADFVTAMMAFFLLMWLLGTTDEKTKKGISDYFQNPWSVAISSSSGDGTGDRTHIIQAGGSDMKSQDDGQVQQAEETPPPPTPALKEEELEKQLEEKEKEKLEKLQAKIEETVQADPNLSEFKDQIKLQSTPEGLKIQIVDAKNRPMFKLASSNIVISFGLPILTGPTKSSPLFMSLTIPSNRSST